MHNKVIPTFVWFIPVALLAMAGAIYFGELQSDSFLFINRFTQLLPDTLWAWLTFLGNGWGVFALAFPLLLIAPRMLTAGIFAGAIAALASAILKRIFDLPRPAGILTDGSFYRIGEALLHRAFLLVTPSRHLRLLARCTFLLTKINADRCLSSSFLRDLLGFHAML